MFWVSSFSFLATKFCTSVGGGGGFEIVSAKCAAGDRGYHLTNLKNCICVFCASSTMVCEPAIQHISLFSTFPSDRELAKKYLVQSLASTFLCWCPVSLALTEDTGGMSWAPGAVLGSARTGGVGNLPCIVTPALIREKLAAGLPHWKVKYGKQEVAFIHPKGSLTNLDTSSLTAGKWNHFWVQ